MSQGESARTRRSPTGDSEVDGPARLVVLRGDRPGRQHVLDDDRTVIGRALDCEMRFDDAQLSRRHAIVHRHDDGTYVVEDLNSSNGTFLNGTPVNSPTPLELGDKLQLGSALVLQLVLHDAVHEELSQRQRLEMLGRLGAGIAHDFNNMLGAVLSNVDYLSQLEPETRLKHRDVHETLADIRVAATRAADLSRRLVAFARGRSDGDAVVDASHVCQEVARLARRTFPRTIALDAATGARLRIAGSSLELHQVLMNLCLNARDAMPAGGLLRITAELDEAGDEPEVVIRVQDSGEGMDEATKRRIFEPFFTTKREKGFGVGLATVREIVTLLGGNIDVDTQLGRGTTFELRFPRAAPNAHRHATSSVRPRAGLIAGLSIMVVDDEDMVRRSTRRVLRRAGHEVTEVAGGEEAIALYAQRPADLVLLDLDMPDMAGEAVLEQLLASDPDANVVMITGHHDDERELALLERGAREVIHKPWAPGELLDCMHRTVATSGDDPYDGGRPTHA